MDCEIIGRREDGAWDSPAEPQHKTISAVLVFRGLNAWAAVTANFWLVHNPWASSPLKPSALPVSQHVPNAESRTMEFKEGKPLTEILQLPKPWPPEQEKNHKEAGCRARRFCVRGFSVNLILGLMVSARSAGATKFPARLRFAFRTAGFCCKVLRRRNRRLQEGAPQLPCLPSREESNFPAPVAEQECSSARKPAN